MSAQPIKIAILAMGGEGGGVLADWIVRLGEANGHIAQTTSVPGVAQRTGATVYYVELFPEAEAAAGSPVLALMPLPGDVDVVLASELMEAGRAVQRGLVTPDRTTLLASTHRVYAVAEKIVPGDGRVSSAELLAHARAAARRCIAFDMAAVAEDSGSVISAVLFGALAGSGVLPFERAAFEATIRQGSVGVAASLKAFDHAWRQAQAEAAADPAATPAAAPSAPLPRSASHPQVQGLLTRIHERFAPSVRPWLVEGLRRLVDYQDPPYGGEYLDRVERFLPLDRSPDSALLQALARHLALWMSYEDTARIAQLKTRAERFERVRGELRAGPGQVLHIDDYLHPRLQEICESLPAGLGRWLQTAGAPRRWVETATQRGRVLHTSSLGGFVLLWLVAGTRRWRRGSLRHALETARIEAWLAAVERAARQDLALAVEVAQCQQLIKGYGDTHERGLRRFEAVMLALQTTPAPSATRAQALRQAALADEEGLALQAALAQG